jgi:hypothetical protein
MLEADRVKEKLKEPKVYKNLQAILLPSEEPHYYFHVLQGLRVKLINSI